MKDVKYAILLGSLSISRSPSHAPIRELVDRYPYILAIAKLASSSLLYLYIIFICFFAGSLILIGFSSSILQKPSWLLRNRAWYRSWLSFRDAFSIIPSFCFSTLILYLYRPRIYKKSYKN